MTKKAVSKSIKVCDIKTDPAFQNRDTNGALIKEVAEKALKQHVQELAADIKANDLKKPVVVYKIEGEDGYTLVSGHHRVKAVAKLGRTKIDANIYEGTRSKAWAHSKFCNLDRIKPLDKRELSENAWDALKSDEDNYFREVVIKGSGRMLADELKVGEKTIRRMISCMKLLLTNDKESALSNKEVCQLWSEQRPHEADEYNRWTDAVKLLSDREKEYDEEFKANSEMVTRAVAKALRNIHGLGSLSPEEVIHGLEATAKELKQGKEYPLHETLQFMSEEENEDF